MGYKAFGPKVEAKAIYSLLTLGLSLEEYRARNQDGPAVRTYERWMQHFETYGEIPWETRRRKKRNKGKRFNFTMPGETRRILVQRALMYPSRFLYEFQEYLDCNQLGFYSVQTISRVLHQNGLSKATLQHIAAEACTLRQQEFINRIHAVPSLEMFICVDETHKDRRAGQFRYGWGLLGKPHLLVDYFNDFSKVLYTLIAKKYNK